VRRGASLLACAAGLVLLLAGGAWWLGEGSSGSPGGPRHHAAASRPARPTFTAPPAAPAAWRPGAPRRLLVPALHVAAPVLPIGTVGRTLVPPADPTRLGWWAAGAVPGAARGSAVVAGHTVHTGGGALDRLGDLRPGDAVVVRTARGRLDYVVRRVVVLRKGTLAERAPQLFDQRGPGRLVLVTCTDWDGTRYLGNTVVIAVPARRAAAQGAPAQGAPDRSAAR
jgi:LPXTG-site transpeptidase (sortase) family protein